MTNKDEEDAKVVWMLDDSYTSEPQWLLGQVEMRAAEDSPEYEYHVSSQDIGFSAAVAYIYVIID